MQAMAIYITGHGSKLVPRMPFCVTFRPPKIAIECGTKVVFFGPADDGLGFSAKDDATVEDVTLDIMEYPSVPVYCVHTQHFAVPVTDNVVVYSADEKSGRSFEVQLSDAADRDEMLWVQGPLSVALDLQNVSGALHVVDEGTVAKHNGEVRWRECQYMIDDTIWHKRFYAVTLPSTKKLGADSYFAFLAQCSSSRRKATFDLSDRWVGALNSQDGR
jgi:hypothetical protein